MTADPLSPNPHIVDHRTLRNALGQFSTGVCLVTTHWSGQPVGMVANSFAAVSLDPPLVLWSIACRSRRYAAFAGASHYAIHVLAQDQADMVTRFSNASHDFGAHLFEISADGIPILPHCLARFECRSHAHHDGGDHLILVGDVVHFQQTEGAPLVFSQGQYGAFSAD